MFTATPEVNSQTPATPPPVQVHSAPIATPTAATPTPPPAAVPVPDGTPHVVPPSSPTPTPSNPGGQAAEPLADTWGAELIDTGLSEEAAAALVLQLQQQQPQPPAVPQAPPPAPAVVAPVATPAPAPEEPPAPDDLPHKLRIHTGRDPVAVNALNIFSERAAAGNPISLTAAESLARQVLGLEDSTAVPTLPQTTPAVPTATPAPAAPTAPESVQQLDAKAEALQAELVQVSDLIGNGYDPARAAEIQRSLLDIATQKAVHLVRSEIAAQTQQTSAATFEAEWQASFTQAAQDFPSLSDPTSPLHLLAGSLQNAAAADPAHPAHAITRKGESAAYFARQAAVLLHLQPVSAPAAAPSPSVSPSAPPVPVTSPPQPPLATILGGGSMPPSAPSPGADFATETANWSAEQWANLAYLSQPGIGGVPVH